MATMSFGQDLDEKLLRRNGVRQVLLTVFNRHHAMSPTDKNKSSGNSTNGKSQSQQCSDSNSLEFQPKLAPLPTTSDVTSPGHDTIANIPLVTASQSTTKCSINDQMKTFDPGEDGVIERLNHNGNPSFPGRCSLVKNNKNYKAGSKINKLADMLAKRSQNVVEVRENTPQVTVTSAPKEETITAKSLNGFENLNGEVFRKSRRKSVPNQSCGLHRIELQSTSKSCSDFTELFLKEMSGQRDINALGGSLTNLQTDESTKKKAIRKNIRNVELPLILPERKRRSVRNEVVKVVEKCLEPSANAERVKSPNEISSSLQSPNRSVSSTNIRKGKRKSKRLVENSTQTADIEFISVIKPKTVDKVATENEKQTEMFECAHCAETFILESQWKAHEKTHSLKNNKLFKCQFCSKKAITMEELRSHSKQKHPNRYLHCLKCSEEFTNKEEFLTHNKEVHFNKFPDGQNGPEKIPDVQEKKKEDEDKKSVKTPSKTDLKIDVSFDSTKKSSVSPRSVQKCSPKETKTEEQLLEQEMLFYSHLSGNIQENLTNHLDGKIDKSGNLVRVDQTNEPPVNNGLLSVASPSATPDVQVSRAPSPYQTRSKTPNPLPATAKKFKKLPNWQQKFWEKYNFPTNYRYEHRFWDKNYLNSEKSAFYLKDLSCLDIKTQLTMRENIKKLDDIKKVEESSKNADNLKFPDYLSLVARVAPESLELETNKNKKHCQKESFKSPGPDVKTRKKVDTGEVKRRSVEGAKMMTRRQSSLEMAKDEKSSKKRKGSLDLSSCQKMTLRRQTSLENLESDARTEKDERVVSSDIKNEVENVPLSPLGSAEISGEWVRPRSYLCGTCCMKFTNLWELEDHKWVSHPNVWCTHYEFEDEKIDKLFLKNEDESPEKGSGESSEMSKSKLTDLYKRYLLPHGSLKTAKLVPKMNFPEQCTKCKKNCLNSSEMHKHMLDCGGDTTWFLTMYSSPMTIKRKWRPFGSRRKKQIGRRDVKRNIPSTPTLRNYHYQHRIRTKPGDVETIQKMLANLPEKRARRAINFDEIKTRSQATIHSNRLLRKRFKSTFSSNFLKLKAMKQKRIKQDKKESSSKSTTDTSSENTPIGSPKRRNKVKESLKLIKEDNSRDGSSDTSVDMTLKLAKKKVKNKKKLESKHEFKTNMKKEKEKPATKNLSESKSKRKQLKEEIFAVDQETPKKAKKKINKSVAGVDEKAEEVDQTPETFVEIKIKTEELEQKKSLINPRCNSILKYKENRKAKTELLKSMKKKLKNSKKILKQAEKAGSRRSMRLKSLQQGEETPEKEKPSETTPKNGPKNSDNAKKSKKPKAKETPDKAVRRSLRNSLSVEDKVDEITESKNDVSELVSVSDALKKPQNDRNLRSVKESPRSQKSPEGDLEEMPILAKVQPIRGKVTREKEIPVLMPVEEASSEDTISFQVIKKRKTASKEVAPLKIVKKVENMNGNPESSPEVGKRKKKFPEAPVGERVEKRIKTERKYFLGIDPNEIDKGRQEESGSDSEPLITLVQLPVESVPENVDKVSEEIKPSEEEVKQNEVEENLEKDKIEEETKRVEEPPVPEPEKVKDNEIDSVQEEQQTKKKTPKKKKPKEIQPEPEENPPSFLERRSRRVSKEIKSSNEFVIDDPLILVDELWSDLDSDTDTRRKTKKGKKKTPKKEKKTTDVNLEELLRNFGENSKKKIVRKPARSIFEIRKALESRVVEKSYRRLSLKLFRFNKVYKNFGNRGERLAAAKKAVQKKLDESRASLPDLPFLAAEIKENPVQVIQCGAQKTKTKIRKKSKQSDIHLKISLPLENINNMTMFNNNHLLPDEPKPLEEVEESQEEKENQEMELKNKSKRSEVIDKIFYCEICKTYYYSSSQLKIHKLSNRHKMKESELLEAEQVPKENTPAAEPECIEAERMNEDTLEMPTLEGPFIENPLVRAEPVIPPPPPQPQAPPSFGFSQESLKDIQRAIGCTDEEMLILTLLGENTVENEILDLDNCKTSHPTNGNHRNADETKENEKANGTLNIDLKQRMTSALACLVNKAVFNLLQKYETAAKSAVNPEALSLLGKLSNLSRKKNILQLNELLRKNDGESSIGVKDAHKKDTPVSYKYQCTICGSRFEKASTREFHISRSHKGKAKKAEEVVAQAGTEEDWNNWNFDIGDDHLESTNTSQFWCSDCGINFLSPQEVLNHQKIEHQTGTQDQTKDSGPLQSSTIGSSDEIVEGKKIRKRTKLFSTEELDQQRILANNELRKLDRKFSKKSGKIKWGMDALKFSLEKENKVVPPEEEKEVVSEEAVKPSLEIKNIDLVPKLNLSRISNIPEFKVIQKNSFKNRFQKIIDNKLKRKNAAAAQENEQDEIEEVMLVPVVVKKKSKKPKLSKYSKKEKCGKPLDVYDFNESESEQEPEMFSHVKKPPPKLKLVKLKESPSKNKADSTTKAPDDYDSEDSLPLSVVKKSKPEDDEDDKGGKLGEDKSDGILEQVEYLIEQLENETGQKEEDAGKEKDNEEFQESLTVSIEGKFPELELQKTTEKAPEEGSVAESSIFDEEDSIPLVLMKKTDDVKEKNMDVTDVSTTSEDFNRFKPEDKIETPPTPQGLSLSENESREKPCKPFETLNGNVIYCRNDSVSDFGSDVSNDGLIDSNFEQVDKNSVVCSKSEDSNEKPPERKQKRYPLLTATIEENFLKSESPKPYKEAIVRKIWNRRKLRENSSDSFTSTDENTHESQAEVEKEIIVKKIWSRKKPEEDLEKAEETDLKINQTEISDEVVIKCGPKAKPAKRQKRSLTSEASKETIMRKIWSGRFQTKAALKTYEFDMIPNCKENEGQKGSKRRRSGGFSTKKSRAESDDDLDSLLEEIEREQLEKAIRSEFLQLRRSEKASVELKESLNPTVGIFTETIIKRKEAADRKRKRVSKMKDPRQSALKRKKFMKKPMRRVFPVEEKIFSENRMNPDVDLSDSLDKNGDGFTTSKIKNRKHKKHRHKHHHHKHKHKKSKHHKGVTSKHKTKHKTEEDKADSFTILEKICEEIPNRIENESGRKSPETSDDKTKDGVDFDEREKRYGTGNVYEFAEDSTDSKSQNVSLE